MNVGLDVDLTPAEVNFYVRRGDTFEYQLTYQENGVAVDVSGDTFQAQIRKTADVTEVVSMSVDMSDAANGNFVLSLTDEQTAAMDGTYEWDLQRTHSGAVRTLLGGSFTFQKDITR